MDNQNQYDWIENYGFILFAFAHMTDWRLAESEIEVINEKLQLMLSETQKEFKEIDVNFGNTIQKFHIGKGSIAVPGNISGLLKTLVLALISLILNSYNAVYNNLYKILLMHLLPLC